MAADRLHQVPAMRPIKGCFRSFDRIAQSGMFSLSRRLYATGVIEISLGLRSTAFARQ
jgi:hypothetical protein